jgi:hypothetical protein
MATKYRLPCHNDAYVAVDASQAGLAVTCPCGEDVQVPTWRELSRLQPVEDVADRATAGRRATGGSTWSPQKGLIFLGLVILVGGGASAGYWNATIPTEKPIQVNYEGISKHVDSLTLLESMQDWSELRKGLSRGELPPMQMYLAMQEAHRRWTYISLGGCAVGVVFCAIGVATGGKSRNKARRRAP